MVIIIARSSQHFKRQVSYNRRCSAYGHSTNYLIKTMKHTATFSMLNRKFRVSVGPNSALTYTYVTPTEINGPNPDFSALWAGSSAVAQLPDWVPHLQSGTGILRWEVPLESNHGTAL